MSKQILIEALKKDGLTGKDAGGAVDTIVSTIIKELKKTHKFSLTGFGTFKLSRRAARAGRNPRTGEAIKIRASKSVRFKPGTTLKDAL